MRYCTNSTYGHIFIIVPSGHTTIVYKTTLVHFIQFLAENYFGIWSHPMWVGVRNMTFLYRPIHFTLFLAKDIIGNWPHLWGSAGLQTLFFLVDLHISCNSCQTFFFARSWKKFPDLLRCHGWQPSTPVILWGGNSPHPHSTPLGQGLTSMTFLCS